MSFLQNLQSFGTVETTRSYSYSKLLDPMQRLRMNFIQNATRQVAEVKSGAVLSTNAWVSMRKLVGGRVQYKVSLRVGPKLMQLPGGTHIVMSTPEKVIQFFEGVIQACQDGELDDLLQETAAKKNEGQHSPDEESTMSS